MTLRVLPLSGLITIMPTTMATATTVLPATTAAKSSLTLLAATATAAHTLGFRHTLRLHHALLLWHLLRLELTLRPVLTLLLELALLLRHILTLHALLLELVLLLRHLLSLLHTLLLTLRCHLPSAIHIHMRRVIAVNLGGVSIKPALVTIFGRIAVLPLITIKSPIRVFGRIAAIYARAIPHLCRRTEGTISRPVHHRH